MIGRLSSRTLLLLIALSALAGALAHAATPDIVLYTSDVTTVQGNWARVSDSTAAGGQKMSSADNGWSATDAALASPGDYFEATFSAPAATAYHVWLRMHASSNSKWNDSVYAQFSDAVDPNSGSSLYRIGSSSGLVVNLATDSSGSTLSGWGWQDRAYWIAQTSTVKFSGSGTHTIRVQTREDGVQIDQIVLSPATYLSSAPGSLIGDTTIVAKSTSSTTTSSSSSSPYSGTAAAIPGTIAVQNFDNGGEGVAYHDSTAGNSGGAYRTTDVDLEPSADGGNNLGWTAAGEWLAYSVNVASAGTYSVTFRVASPGQGGSFHIEMNGSNVSGSVAVPNTGGWQTWQSVTATATLAAGVQKLALVMDTTGSTGSVGNFNTMAFSKTSSSSTSSSSSSTAGPYTGTPVNLPGTVEAENFDNGGEGVGYHDTTAGNSGSQYRSTDVDIEASSEGGYDIGWTAPGEWLNYTVNVASAGSYTVSVRVASTSSSTMHVGFNNTSSVWQSISIPATGGWQSWQTVSFNATLGAGTQQMTVYFDNGGVNLNSIGVAAGSSSSSTTSTTSGGSSSGGTSTLNVAEWNIKIDSTESHARSAMDFLMSINPRPQVVVIEEGWSAFFSVYIDELQRQTGQTWHGAWAYMCEPGNWNGSSCNVQSYEGIGIFSTYDITSSGSIFLPYPDCYESARPAVRAALNVNGLTVQVFGAHLQTGGCADNAQERYDSMSLIKSWASNYSAPQIAAGDFNADPDQIDTTSGMSPMFVDTWQIAGSGPGYTESYPTPTMKLDYWFQDNQGRASVQSTAVVTNTGGLSDHLPVRATFQVR